MAECIDFDPDGDVILILSKWCKEGDENKDQGDEKVLSPDTESQQLPVDEGDVPAEAEVTAVEAEIPEDQDEVTEDNIEVLGGQDGVLRHHDSKNTALAEQSPDLGNGDEPSHIRMRVSSKHLTLVSPIFKSLLKGGYKESQSLSSRGTAEIPLPDDDCQALEILLNIIHGRLKHVPRTLSLDELTQITVLVDKYQLQEVTEMFSQAWIDLLKKRTPIECTNELLPWICIAWVFKEADHFAKTTKIALLESEGHLSQTLEITLPIPSRILG
jgi:hypothetical protein